MAKLRNKVKNNLGLSDKVFDTIVTIFVSIWLLIVLYPLIYVLSSSFSSGEAVTSGRVLLWPVDFSLTGYELVFKNQKVWTGYANTIFYTVVCTFINVVYTIMMAYVLSRKDFQARKLFTTLYLIPMWFGGGMIPKYVLMANLGLTNSRWGFVLMTGIGISNMIIMRTYFQSSIPGEMLEAGKVDGITDVGYLLKIALPLAKPVISVITLYYLVGHWNDYFGPLIYLRDENLQPLQLILRGLLASAKVDTSAMTDLSAIAKISGAEDVMKYSLIVVSTLPMLILYPFVQKFFDKGVMMGSLKG